MGRRPCYEGREHPAHQATGIARSTTIGIDQAYRTLCDAAAFLSAGRASPAVDARQVRYPSRVIANGLRELDRFLSILLDEIATADGWAAKDLASLARVRNTPNKIEAIDLHMHVGAGQNARLRALGRCRDTLFHCSGVVRRGDHRFAKALTLGWPADSAEGAPQVLDRGDRISVSPADLASICAFYVSIGDNLVRHDRHQGISRARLHFRSE